ncbi:hypothetical protein M378DRAFT_81106 [Amanita muscaria Koide BX008]|uniref:Multifunctional tryptophan biosynthesis protein n=1 Tax=Amanita muscaria (strain Koide BX008) TaxID=946122 RepID=A0A0C2T7M1_AMAMK|nr:hypothetical protein M378DRAFT_81106 [Amanita muscaria Koide BX008]
MAAASLPPFLSEQLDVLMIDNFDSFTWNLYQQLSLLGVQVTVIRNDAISSSLIPQLRIRYLIISPGPGHPQTDSGISRDAITYFAGKVPILGVCMGLECLVDMYGGQIAFAGEIMHGKVSKVRHDNRGCFRNVPQGITSIRYHSLSAQPISLPEELAITAISEESGVIMGVRHRKYTIEAVQYHPESILSEKGDDLIRNFLSLRGGLWEENPQFKVHDTSLPPFPVEVLPKEISSKPESTSRIPSILEKIHTQRLEDVAKAQITPGTTFQDLETLHKLNAAPPLISFVSRIKQTVSGRPALFAEIKRASPSKGPISTSTNPASQAVAYALSGAHVISVLTEPKWFLGTLQDMLQVRQVVTNLPNRPAILRKDFIFSRYQVLESRIWGADTILLIVSMLSESLLRDLFKYSQELGMEPLVEVNNAREMQLALSLPAKVIGVNNRNLHDFHVDMNTTSRLSDMVKDKDVTLCALSGISTSDDVKRYAAEGVNAVLIGESLMRAKDPAAFIRELFSISDVPSPTPYWRANAPLVKICGIRTEDEALAIAEAGADLLGMIFVPSSKRYVSLEKARAISSVVHSLRFSSSSSLDVSEPPAAQSENTPWLTAHANRLASTLNRFPSSRPLLVGVFQNATLDEIMDIVASVQLDMVQLHGSEPIEWARRIPVPVIRVFHVNSSVAVANNAAEGESATAPPPPPPPPPPTTTTTTTASVRDITQGGEHQFVLLDSVRSDGSGISGGSGKVVDLEFARSVVEAGELGVEHFHISSSPVVALSNGTSADGPSSGIANVTTDNGVDNVAGAGAGVDGSDGSDGTSTTAAAMTITTTTAQTTMTGHKRPAYPLPVILAGGLTPDNVAEAVDTVGPWAVDVSGGVEAADGRSKDLDKVRAFINAAKVARSSS